MFHSRLKELRTEHSETQEDLARLLDVSQMTVVRYESGKTQPNPDKLPLLAKHYSVSIDYLLGYTDLPNAEKIIRENAYFDTVSYIKEIAEKKPGEVPYIRNINHVLDFKQSLNKESRLVIMNHINDYFALLASAFWNDVRDGLSQDKYSELLDKIMAAFTLVILPEDVYMAVESAEEIRNKIVEFNDDRTEKMITLLDEITKLLIDSINFGILYKDILKKRNPPMKI